MAADFRVPMAPIVDAFGVEAIVRPAIGAAISTSVVWVPDQTIELQSVGGVRRQPRRELTLLRSDVDGDALARGTRIEAPAERSGATQGWVIDSEVHREWDHVRVLVVPDPDWQQVNG